jgi:hypothetical protein
MPAQGNALGIGPVPETQALKGRNNRPADVVSPFQGYNMPRMCFPGRPKPRALPWAIVFGPFGALDYFPFMVSIKIRAVSGRMTRASGSSPARSFSRSSLPAIVTCL